MGLFDGVHPLNGHLTADDEQPSTIEFEVSPHFFTDQPIWIASETRYEPKSPRAKHVVGTLGAFAVSWGTRYCPLDVGDDHNP